MKIKYYPEGHELIGTGMEAVNMSEWFDIETDDGMRFRVKQVQGGIEVMATGDELAIIPMALNVWKLVDLLLFK